VKPAEYAKAIASALAAGLVMYFSVRDGGVTSDEWVQIVAAVIASSGLTWLVPNATQPVVRTLPAEPTEVNVTRSPTLGYPAGAHEKLIEGDR
jgi:hypothetical protein